MIEPVKDVAFSASAREEPSRLLITLSGSTELHSKDHLHRFMKEVHEEACARAIGEVTVDLRGARFVNSTCLKVLASWILKGTPEARSAYKIAFITSKTHPWQSRSLAALTFLAPARVSVITEVEAPPAV